MTIEKRVDSEKHLAPQTWFPFYGGLGDILLRIYQTKFWHSLEHSDRRTGVAVASVNPFATELFRWHINRSNLLIYDLANALETFSSRGLSGIELHEALARFAGLPWPFDWKVYKSPPPPDWKPVFYAPDYLDDCGHFVFHPFAGLKSRSLSNSQLECVLDWLGNLPCNVYVPSRDFIRLQGSRSAHGAEVLPDVSLPPNVIFLKNLSVPATLNLIRNASGFVGTHSSLVLAAAHEGIPSLSLFPDFLSPEFDAAKGYASYLKMDHMSALPFSSVTTSHLNRWFGRTFDLNSIQNSRTDQSHAYRLAREVLERGGKINVDWFCPPDFATPEERKAFRMREIQSVGELPEGRFKIWRLDFRNLADFGDSDLAALREVGGRVDTITNLNLAGTSVTVGCLDSLGWLGGSLRRLDLGENKGIIDRDTLSETLPRAELVQTIPIHRQSRRERNRSEDR